MRAEDNWDVPLWAQQVCHTLYRNGHLAEMYRGIHTEQKEEMEQKAQEQEREMEHKEEVIENSGRYVPLRLAAAHCCSLLKLAAARCCSFL